MEKFENTKTDMRPICMYRRRYICVWLMAKGPVLECKNGVGFLKPVSGMIFSYSAMAITYVCAWV